MQRWNDLAEVPADHGPSVVAIGNFDGVHLGHRCVLSRLVQEARARSAVAVAITFWPHPLHVLHPDRAPELLTGRQDKLDLLASTGLDAVLEMPFTRELAGWSPERFVEDVLVRALGATAVVVGRDIRFGYRNSGDLATMRRLGAEHGFDVIVLDDVGPGEGSPADGPGEGGPGEALGRRWSSTTVRRRLAAGDVAGAAEVLGRPHRLRGTVVHGDHRGRELGFPTANLGPDQTGMVPADGVYAGWLERLDLPAGAPDRRLPAAVSVGTNPTFDGHGRRVEAYVLDRDDLDLYGVTVALDLVERLRGTVRYDGAEALVDQMRRDVEQARRILDSGRRAAR